MQVTDKNEIQKILALIVDPMVKKGMMDRNDAKNIILTIGNAIQAAGGIDPQDKECVNKLKCSIITCLTTMKQSPENAPAMADTMKLLFKNATTLNPAEKKKLSLGLALIIAMEKDPSFKPNMGLALRDPKTPLTKEEKKALFEDLEKMANILNSKCKPPLDKNELADLMKLVKDEINNPGLANAKRNPNDMENYNKNFDKNIETNIESLEGRLGSMGLPLMNAMGITVKGPASTMSPLNVLNDAIPSSLQTATTGSVAAEYEESLGEENDLVASFLNHPEPSLQEPVAEPKTITDDLLSAVEDSIKPVVEVTAKKAEVSANNSEELAKNNMTNEGAPEEPKYESPSPFKMKPSPLSEL